MGRYLNSNIFKLLFCIAVFTFNFVITEHLYALEKRLLLITEAESAMEEAKFIKGFGSKEPSDGPVIEFNKPTPDSEVLIPVGINISFKPQSAPVDLESLEVEYLKFISVDITDRIKPYATEAGINVEKADLPPGSHKVRFSIKDKENRLTEKTLKLTVLESE